MYISQLIRFARVCSNIDDFSNRNLFLTGRLFKQAFRYHKIKTRLQHGTSEPIFYGYLVLEFKRTVRKLNFSDQFKKIIKIY